MKIMIILGTRPEIIRLSRIISKLESLCDLIIVHTGQNFDPKLNDIFFNNLQIRNPDYFLGTKGTMGEQVGQILTETEKIMIKEKPDKILILGDTNSALSAIIAKRLAIPVFHMEAGNRCYDDRVPEEVNRRIIDHSSDILMPYTERSRSNLIREGITGERIYVTGNPIKEILDYYKRKIDKCSIIEKLKLIPKDFFLITLHRAENVDNPKRLLNFISAFNAISNLYKIPIIWSIHPRTKSKLLKNFKYKLNKNIIPLDPLGLFEFIRLEKNAKCVLTDSGTVQEECCLFKIPNVTLRDVTERPETVEVGSNILSGDDPKLIKHCVQTVIERPCNWQPPPEYLVKDVSSTVLKIILGYNRI
jgi:UDP-N-acetylglucosamine 2-epimerase (non-hydrolysing)